MPYSTFRILQGYEKFPQVRNNPHNQMYNLLRIVHKIFCRTKPNDDGNLFAAKRIVQFPIAKMRGMSRSYFVERLIFPELLTYFLWRTSGKAINRQQAGCMAEAAQPRQFIGNIFYELQNYEKSVIYKTGTTAV